jgi:molecular chaperone DnaK
MEQPARRTFTPSSEGQTVLRVPVLQGVSPIGSINEEQGVIEFPLPKGIPATTPVEVSFKLDANGTLEVTIQVQGFDYVHQETVHRDRARARPGRPQKTLREDWQEELQPTLRAAKYFQETFSDYMDKGTCAEINDSIRRATAALEEGDATRGENLTRELQKAMLSSGVASILFVAERAMTGKPPSVHQALSQLMGQLRVAYQAGRSVEVERLATELRVEVARLVAAERREYVPDQPDFEKKLRDPGGIS